MFNPSSHFSNEQRNNNNSNVTQRESESEDLKKEENKEHRPVFCCSQTMFYKPTRTDHEDLFNSFVKFDKEGKTSQLSTEDRRGLQVVEQINFGPIKEKRYFSAPDFQEMSESDFQNEGYKRLNSFKNFKCAAHNLFFEVNAYKKGLAISHHHTSTVGGSTFPRGSEDIDLTAGHDKGYWNRKY